MNRSLALFSFAVFLFFLVAGVEVWRAADLYDSMTSREYYRARGLSLIIEGVSRVAMLLAAPAIVGIVAGGNSKPSFGAAGSVACVVALLVGTEVVLKTLLQWGMIRSGTVMTSDVLVESTDMKLARFRLSFYPVYMGAIAYVVMQYRSVWATAATTAALALANGVLIVSVTLLFLSIMLDGQTSSPPPEKLKRDVNRLFGFDVNRINVDSASEDPNAQADLAGGITVTKRLMDIVSHRGVVGIVGHEIGHLNHSHNYRRLIITVFLTVMSAVSAVIALRYGTPAASMMGMADNRVTKTVGGFVVFMAVEPVMRIVVAALLSKQSVSHEYEADRFSGVSIGPGPLTEGLTKIGDLYGLSKRAPLVHSFPTHPPTRDRIKALQELQGAYPDKL